MKSSTKCFIVTTLRSLKVTSTDHQKYVEIWKSNIKMFWNSQYNVTQELSTFHLAQSRRKTLNKLWKYCNMEGQLLQNKICITFLFSRKWGFCLGTVDGQKEYWKYNQWLVGGGQQQPLATGLSLLYSGTHKNCSGCYKKLYFYLEKFQKYKICQYK